MTPIAARRRIVFDGRLDVADESGRTFVVTGDGARLVAEIGDLPRPRPTLRLIGSTIVFLRRASRVLDGEALSLAVTRDGTTVLELGRGVRPTGLVRLLGLGRVSFGRKDA